MLFDLYVWVLHVLLSSVPDDLSPEEREELESIRRRKQELLQDIQVRAHSHSVRAAWCPFRLNPSRVHLGFKSWQSVNTQNLKYALLLSYFYKYTRPDGCKWNLNHLFVYVKLYHSLDLSHRLCSGLNTQFQFFCEITFFSAWLFTFPNLCNLYVISYVNRKQM